MKLKRICCGFMAFVLASSLFFCYPVRVVKATALPVDAGLSIEFMELLYSLMVNALLGSGVANAASMDYDSAMELFENFLDGMSQSLIGDYTYILDGEPATLTLKEDAINLWAVDGSYMPDALNLLTLSTDGTGALVIPDFETWQKFRVVQGGKSGGGSGSPDDQDPFTRIEKIKIGSSCLAFMSAWAYNLSTGAVEGIEYQNYIGQAVVPDNYVQEGYPQFYGFSYNGYPVYDVRGAVFVVSNKVLNILYYTSAHQGLYYYPTQEKAILIESNKMKLSFYRNVDGKPVELRLQNSDSYRLLNNGSSLYRSPGTYEAGYNYYNSNCRCAFNAPIFNDMSDLNKYFASFQLQPQLAPAPYYNGVQNPQLYSKEGLSQGLAEALDPLAGIEISPEVVPDVALAVAAAVDPLSEPDPGTDPAENTDIYKAVVQAAVEQALPEAVPDPEPAPDPLPDPAPQPGTQFEDIQDYKLDLTMIFPFCLPFDLVHLLEALSADPVAPRFEIPIYIPGIEYDYTLVLDLSMFDDVAAVFRTGELILFIIGLIFATSKLIKW